MNEIRTLPTLKNAKVEAKALRKKLSTDNPAMTHSEALERVAHRYGFKDWNTFCARLSNQPMSGCPVALGDRISGRYLSCRFSGEIIGLARVTPEGPFRITIHFDEAVDVVTFDSFSAYRQRVVSTIDRNGRSLRKTSDGRPQLEIDL